MSFSDLGLRAELLRAVEAQGYDTPTPIQRQAIPAVLKGGDLLASAQTGTGKTAGFTLPMLQRLAEGPRPAKCQIRALVLTPTRELAAQVGESVRDYGKHLSLTHHVIFGGVGQQPQIDAIRPGLDVLVATPGRLLDLHQQGHVNLSQVEILVLDEADRMLDMGFIHDIRRVLKLLPEKRQNLLFSATFSSEIQALADKLLDRPEMIEVARRNTTAETVDQAVYRVDRERKRELLAHLIESHRWYQVLVFTRTKHGANRLAEHLDKRNITAMAIHGNKSQSARTRALGAFKSGDLQVLVATDIAARGLDIDELPHVVNFELPNVAEDYVHRIGRTGRAGNEGQAVSLVCVDEHGLLKNIERLIKRDLEKRIEPGFEPDPNAKPEPIENGRNRRGGGQRRGGNTNRNSGGGSSGNGGGNQRNGGQRSDNGNSHNRNASDQPARRRRRRGGQGNRQGQA
ncbi:DEAD/DEAH box helicase [Halomonas litopenaei]|uniref:DEAD/DEAH box helicase n=1 Tax=Halomonas litopenaei TaxID=2109328 RepID=UPI001A8FB90A|nr:DEAD/DEAH box helicase [Halomonas litopenaei]MBN8411079.1 DEAD/DEAH box helicase [Halomonas litopenaei]